jgi:UDP-glucose:(heptosyl)LPS alpha-1,3-glucosyltransferase
MTTSARRLRIAVLSRSFSAKAGGAERYSVAMVEQLAASHEIHVFAQSIEFAGNQGLPGVSYHRISMPLRKPRWINQLWFATATWWATRKGFDVVHSHENTWHGNVQTVHVLPVKYNLFHGRTGWRLALRWLKVITSPRLLVYLWLESRRYAVQPGRAVVVTSESLLSIFAATFPQAANMASVITPGIDLPARLPTPADRLAARRQLGLPLDQRCVLFVGNDFRKKGLQKLIEAMRLLQAEGYVPDLVLAVVGASAQLPQFRQQTERAGLDHRVFFLGGMADVSPAYRAADLLICWSIRRWRIPLRWWCWKQWPTACQ